MFLWIDCNGYYHALFHNEIPDKYLGFVGAHAYSMDGYNWTYAGYAFGNDVMYTDQTNQTFSRRERPHLIFSDIFLCSAVGLTSGVQYGGGTYGDAVYSIIQPVQGNL